eukprot:GDKJ01005077.1.p1 GENE.GDKJ01005077.1~~GDKJ01005077.1.p1  ORF type:complete len:973 (-),score=294.30 GDKJ01005077.1:471-3119(-)
MDNTSAYRAAAYSVRDRLIEGFNDTNAFFHEEDVKRCYYLSLEFLIGRAMQNALVNMDVEENYREALHEIGFDLEQLYEREHDAALGNGGLGRLAACFLDSMATLNYACWGYGIRYTYGIFEQKIIDGRQVEHPDYWLVHENPWEIQRPDVTYGVRFYGDVETYNDPQTGKTRLRWVNGKVVQAMAHDYPIPGFDSSNTINLRLWKAAPSKEFDFHAFNSGNYHDAVHERMHAEYISAVLYPNDSSAEGKELRLKQQFFFVSATIQDSLRRFKKNPSHRWSDLPSLYAAQLNDTHPTIAIPEMMRILVDVEDLDWNFAWSLTTQVFNYTNHTVLPEALEKWPMGLIENLLPRHLQIINEINFRFLTEVRTFYNTQKYAQYEIDNILSKLSIYQEGSHKMIRMANLAVIGCNKVNGVAAIHSEIVKSQLFPEFVRFFRDAKNQPNKFINVTNGVTPRRWIHNASRDLSNLFSEALGSDAWLKQLDLLQGLKKLSKNAEFKRKFRAVKLANKERLAEYALQACGAVLDTNALFDVQVKRIHEYKRQFLNILFVIHRYLQMKKTGFKTDDERTKAGFVPRCHIMGGKAAPGYAAAKSIIRLANAVGEVLSNDAETNKWINFTFLPNYNVSSAQIIIPASDVSEHISTAGTEASGTSNMKFVMTGGRIIGTLDGANVEIHEEAGDGCMFIFGAEEHEVESIRALARVGDYLVDPRLQEVVDAIRGGMFSKTHPDAQREFDSLLDCLLNNGHGNNGDFYLLIHDFPLYVAAQSKVDVEYKNPELWTEKCIMQTSATGKFSTDRTIHEYAKNIWNIKPVDRTSLSTGGAFRARSFINLPKEHKKISAVHVHDAVSTAVKPVIAINNDPVNMSSPAPPSNANSNTKLKK